MSVEAEDFLVFETYRHDGDHAFSNNLVSEVDKDRYAAIFEHLRAAVKAAITASGTPEEFDTWICNFGRDGGAQGHRPKSLWASVINRNSEAFSKFPQVYAIASHIGVEVGFSVTIHEDDYHDTAAKQRNRPIVPIINAKLPDPESDMIRLIHEALQTDPSWIFAEKTRNGFNSAYENLPHLIAHLKSGTSSAKGGGAIYRILDFEEAASADSRIQEELTIVLKLFRPLMQLLRPTANDAHLASNMGELAKQANDIPPFEPDNDEDGRKKVLREVAIRQGQPKFRQNILEAYDRRCAISGCNLEWILQAAHISPYNGAKSNHVSNGIPLRADLHTLFDLGLIRIDPYKRTVLVSPALTGTEYEQFSGKLLASPSKPAHRPSQAALIKKMEMFPAGD